MTRRPGLSLTEVLVALFIMGIGTIAVLTLFPLGALNMAQALRDDRTTQAAAQGGAFFRWYWQEQKDQPNPAPPPATQLEAEPMFSAMDNPGMAGGFSVSTTSSAPSYPIVVDPMGSVAPRPAGGAAFWIGDAGNGSGLNQSNLGRRSLNIVTSSPFPQPMALRTCSLLDGLGYATDGSANVSTGAVDRDLRYNWLWVIRRPDNGPKGRFAVEMTVVVFDKRAHMFAPPGTETVHTPVTAAVGSTLLQFATPDVPMVQKGGWLMDATVTSFDATNTVYVPPAAPPAGPMGAGTGRAGVRNANFYRVVSVTDNGGGIDVELETPLKPDTADPGDQDLMAKGQILIQPGHRRFVYLSGAAEVFNYSDLVIASDK